MSSSLTVEQYIALSAAAYGSFSLDDKGKRIQDIIHKIPDSDKPQCSALSSLSSYTLLNFTQNSITGFAAAAFQSPSGELSLERKTYIMYAEPGSKSITGHIVLSLC